MKQQTGVWIDAKKAVIVSLRKGMAAVNVIYSQTDTVPNEAGEVKWFARFANTYLNFKRKKKLRRSHEMRRYLKNVVNEIMNAGELVLFGPAGMKIELEKMIHRKPAISGVISGVETTDTMTDNQVVAWVKNYFQNRN